jgi:proline dehydrogenase
MTAAAQDTDKYREDYDRMQKIKSNTLPAKRADQLIAFIKERSDMDAKILDYVKGLLEEDLRKMKVQGEFPALKESCERAIKADPLLGQAYLYYGFALKNEKKDQEAMIAFAKAMLIPTSSSQQAKVELDKLYKSAHRGSLEGEDKLIADARREINKLKK